MDQHSRMKSKIPPKSKKATLTNKRPAQGCHNDANKINPDPVKPHSLPKVGPEPGPGSPH